MIRPSVEHEHDIMSKSGAGDAGVGVFCGVFLESLGMSTVGFRLFERFGKSIGSDRNICLIFLNGIKEGMKQQ